jgi:hypothetical protein
MNALPVPDRFGSRPARCSIGEVATISKDVIERGAR